MGKQWVRQEMHKNEVADALGSVRLWLERNRQAAAWAGAGLLAALLLAAAYLHRRSQALEESWGKLALAQSYAYSGRPEQALALAREVVERHGASLAAGHALLLTGDVHYQESRWSEAQASYQQALERSGDPALEPLALAGLALAQEAAGDCQASTKTDERLLEAHQDHFLAPQAHASLARCLGALGQADKAKATLERMALLYPETRWAEWAKARLKG